jgi:polysaccharide export outer membrane protein
MKLVSLFVLMLCSLRVVGAAEALSPAAEQPPAAQAGQMDESSDYIIGPGDTLQVYVWRNPELSLTVPVRTDGKVTTPLIEDLVAVGQTPSSLARLMEQRLSEYIRSPQVNIIVTSAQSALNRVMVIGQVGEPQAVPYRQGMTVLDAVLAVGGLTDFAAGNRAKIMRKDSSGKEEEIRVKLADLLNKGRIKENVDLQPGDVLVVPESLF